MTNKKTTKRSMDSISKKRKAQVRSAPKKTVLKRKRVNKKSVQPKRKIGIRKNLFKSVFSNKLVVGLTLAMICFFAVAGVLSFVNSQGRVKGEMDVNEPQKIVPEIYTDPVVASWGLKTLSIQPMAGEKVRVRKEDVRYIYEGAYKNTDVIQTVYPYKIKEQLVFYEPGHPMSFKYRLGNWESYIIKEDDEGNIIFYDRQNYEETKELARIFTIPTPYIEDKVGSRSFKAVTTIIKDENLTISVDQNWLKTAKYPVVLDPTIEINVINVQSYPVVGGEWKIEFTTQGKEGLTITGMSHDEYKTIFDEDVEFKSLRCGQAEIQTLKQGNSYLAGVWECADKGILTLKVLKPGKHHLQFDLGGEKADAYNDAEDAWWDSDWDYRLKITINNAQVDADVTNFPVYVNLDDLPDATFWTHVKTACADVRIVKPDGTTELPREIVVCDTDAKTGEIHFKADALADLTDTEFYIYYGNSSASDYAVDATYGAQKVWDDGGNNYYKGVWHMPNGASLTALDSTANGKNGTVNGTVTATAGQVDGGGLFDGSSGYISGSPVSVAALTNYTVSVWIKPDGLQGQDDAVVTDVYSSYVNYAIHFDESSYPSLRIFGGSYTGGWKRTPSATLSDGVWAYAAHTYDGSTLKLYINDNSSLNTSSVFTPASNNLGFRIGRRWDMANYVKGTIDEVRISSIARSAGWIGTEYNNQSSSSTFYSLSDEESVNSDPVILLVTDSPDPVNAGQDVIFLVDWNDADASENIKAKICKTDSLTNQNCDGGYWATSTDFTASDPEEVSYTTTADEVGTNNYYAFVCDDGGACSSSDPGTFSVNPWLAGWGKRREISVQNTNIDSTLINFPVALFINTAAGINNTDVTSVFNEVGDNWQKIAVTSDDKLTELYVEKEAWDSVSETAVLWVSSAGLFLSSTSTRSLYFYYDNDHAENTTYIGGVASTSSQNVWDSNFKLVSHMTADFKNSADGTTLINSGSDASSAGVAGESRNFIAANNDYIDTGSSFSLGSGAFTAEIWYKGTQSSSYVGLMGRVTSNGWTMENHIGKIRSWVNNDYDDGLQSLVNDSWHYAVMTRNSTVGNVYFDGNGDNIGFVTSASSVDVGNVYIGSWGNTTYDTNGLIDEVRISASERPSAWVKATYYTMKDNLVIWGVAESASVSSSQVKTHLKSGTIKIQGGVMKINRLDEVEKKLGYAKPKKLSWDFNYKKTERKLNELNEFERIN